jgi:hypothetical protein
MSWPIIPNSRLRWHISPDESRRAQEIYDLRAVAATFDAAELNRGKRLAKGKRPGNSPCI